VSALASAICSGSAPYLPSDLWLTLAHRSRQGKRMSEVASALRQIHSIGWAKAHYAFNDWGVEPFRVKLS
jgi:hypothetical protein